MLRLLLPFTSEVEMDVLELLIRLASYQRAILVPLSLIPLSTTRHQRVRLELLQQSQDFLEATRAKAARLQVPIEPVEIFTHESAQSILTSVERFHCDGILLASRETRESLVSAEILQHLLCTRPCALLVVHFPAHRRGGWMAKAHARFLRWWSAHSNNQATLTNAVDAPNFSNLVLVPLLKGGNAARAQREEAASVHSPSRM